jgi:CRP-like cAMP-binding protein
MTKQVDSSQLKAFSPIDSLKKDNLAALVKKTKVRDAQPGEALFREGDAEKRTFYILSGTVELREGSQAGTKVKAAPRTRAIRCRRSCRAGRPQLRLRRSSTSRSTATCST